MTTIPPQHQQILQAAVSSGRFETEEDALAEALRLLTERTAGRCSESALLPPDEWIREFNRVSASRTGGNPNMDDSRESI